MQTCFQNELLHVHRLGFERFTRAFADSVHDIAEKLAIVLHTEQSVLDDLSYMW